VTSCSITATTTATDVTCNGGADGTASVTASGGTGTLAYLWDDVNSQTTASATGLAAGTYTVIVTDANNCTTTASATVAEPSALIVSAGLDDTICYGGSIILNGSGAMTYLWDNGTTDGTAFTPTATTTYTLTGTDANGCIGSDDVLVTVNALPIVDAGGSPTLVWGPTDVNNNTETISLNSNELYELYINHSDVNPDGFGSIKFTYTDGTVDEFKFWGNGGMRLWDPLTASYGNNYTVGIHSSAFMSEANTSMQYYVECSSVTGVNTWTFRNLDTGLTSIELTDNASWQGLLGSQISLISSQGYTVCEGESVTLNGSGAVTYAWDNGITDATAFTPTATATYTVTGTDANGCIGTDAVDVTVNAIYNNTLTLSVCFGDSA
jgi:hypothetical protein